MEEVWEHEKTPSTTDSALTKNFMSSVSLKYFEKELRGPLTGICSLVANAFLYCKDNSTLATVDEARFHMTLLGLLGSMTSLVLLKIIRTYLKSPGYQPPCVMHVAFTCLVKILY